MTGQARSIDIDLQTVTQVRGNRFLDDVDTIREREPVFWSEMSQCWILTRHSHVADMFMDRLPLRHAGRIEAAFVGVSPADRPRIAALLKYVPMWVINLDGERHMRIRTLLLKAFNRRIVEQLRDFARAEANRLLDQAIDRQSFEFNEGFARPMTGHVLFRLLGLPEHVFPQLKEWATAVVEGLGAVKPTIEMLERADRAVREMNEAVTAVLEERRRTPRDDLLTGMLNVTEGGERLSVDELLAQMQIIIVAGHDTTANTMTLGVEALSRHPEAWQYMRDHPEEIATCVAEIQRYSAMSAAQVLLAAEDFELDGKAVKAGQAVVGMIAAADRDPLKFDNPDVLDLTRDNRHSLAFTTGPHFCLGHWLAKMQLAEFFSALVERADSIDLLDEKLDFMPVFTFRGLYSLNVHIRPRAQDLAAAR